MNQRIIPTLMTRILSAVAFLMMLVLLAPDAVAAPQPFLTGFALNSPPKRQDFAGFAGMQFTVGALPLSVSSLGRVCISGNSQTHTVKLVSASTKTDVPGASVQVNMAGCTGGQFTYTSLGSPVTLLASTTYYLVSQEFANTGESWYDSGAISTRADAAVISSVYLSGGIWSTPGGANTAYVPPDMQYVTLAPSALSFVLNYNQNNQPVRSDFTGFVGMTLNIGLAPLNVTSVGRVCVAGNSGTHTVKFVDATTGADVAGGAASVNMMNCAASQFVYANLASTLTLTASKTYYLVSSETIGGDSWYGQGTMTTTADASVPAAVYSLNGSWVQQPGVNTSYVPPNFQYSTGVIVPPVPVNVTVGTAPAGLSITVDGTIYTSPKTFNWNSGDTHTIATTSPQTLVSSQYVFGSWSDGGTLSHTVTVSPGTTSYTATFTLQAAQYLLTTAVSPAGSGTVSGGGVFYTAGTAATIIATANSGYTFVNWTGAVSSPTSATTTITMNSAQSVTANFVASATGSTQIIQDHKATISDFFAFVSYDDPTKVTFILNVDPRIEPGSGPIFAPFDDNIQYSINIDNNNDAAADITFQFQFTTVIRPPVKNLAFLGAGAGISAPANSPAPVTPGASIVPPAITALSGAGGAGLSLSQSYTVTMVKGGVSTVLTTGSSLYAVPTNVGPRTMPNYPALAAQGIYTFGNGIRVFAGTTDEPFYADLGAMYDTFNFRTAAGGGVLSAAADADDHTNTAPDYLSGYNVNSIAIEVPITMLTRTGNIEVSTSTAATIGAWGTTARPSMITLQSPMPPVYSGSFSQIQRMGNPLINDLLIGLSSKNSWTMSAPVNDSQFASFYLDPLLARQFNAIYGIAIPTPPRTDLLPLLTYAPPIAAPGTTAGPIADLLRLNTGVAPTPQGSRKRLGLLAGDAAGFPNGRRVSDDVLDITLRVGAGILAGPQYNYPIGDGVNTNDVPYQETFPYLAWAQSGRQRRHIDPGEAGCTQGAGAACPTN